MTPPTFQRKALSDVSNQSALFHLPSIFRFLPMVSGLGSALGVAGVVACAGISGGCVSRSTGLVGTSVSGTVFCSRASSRALSLAISSSRSSAWMEEVPHAITVRTAKRRKGEQIIAILPIVILIIGIIA